MYTSGESFFTHPVLSRSVLVTAYLYFPGYTDAFIFYCLGFRCLTFLSHQNQHWRHLAGTSHCVNRYHAISRRKGKIQEDSEMQGTLPAAVAVPEVSVGGFFLLK